MLKIMFGTESIYSFFDTLKQTIEKQRDQLKEQIMELDNFDKIQEQLRVGSNKAGLEDPKLE